LIGFLQGKQGVNGSLHKQCWGVNVSDKIAGPTRCKPPYVVLRELSGLQAFLIGIRYMGVHATWRLNAVWLSE
jgi:hypothetical protein